MSGRLFKNASAVTLGHCQVGAEQCACVLARPPEGGSIHRLYFVAGDMRDLCPPVNLPEVLPSFLDAFSAEPFVSGIDGVLKAFVLYKPDTNNGNDRLLAIVSTGVVPVVTE